MFEQNCFNTLSSQTNLSNKIGVMKWNFKQLLSEPCSTSYRSIYSQAPHKDAWFKDGLHIQK